MRLRRLAPGATYQADQHRLLMPVPVPDEDAGYAPGLVALLGELVPAAEAAPVPAPLAGRRPRSR